MGSPCKQPLLGGATNRVIDLTLVCGSGGDAVCESALEFVHTLCVLFWFVEELLGPRD